MTRTDVSVISGGTELSGSVWTPDGGAPTAVVSMYPGSGPSDRDNDVFFPPIREELPRSGFAVASFDNRGVGSSRVRIVG